MNNKLIFLMLFLSIALGYSAYPYILTTQTISDWTCSQNYNYANLNFSPVNGCSAYNHSITSKALYGGVDAWGSTFNYSNNNRILEGGAVDPYQVIGIADNLSINESIAFNWTSTGSGLDGRFACNSTALATTSSTNYSIIRLNSSTIQNTNTLINYTCEQGNFINISAGVSSSHAHFMLNFSTPDINHTNISQSGYSFLTYQPINYTTLSTVTQNTTFSSSNGYYNKNMTNYINSTNLTFCSVFLYSSTLGQIISPQKIYYADNSFQKLQNVSYDYLYTPSKVSYIASGSAPFIYYNNNWYLSQQVTCSGTNITSPDTTAIYSIYLLGTGNVSTTPGISTTIPFSQLCLNNPANFTIHTQAFTSLNHSIKSSDCGGTYDNTTKNCSIAMTETWTNTTGTTLDTNVSKIGPEWITYYINGGQTCQYKQGENTLFGMTGFQTLGTQLNSGVGLFVVGAFFVLACCLSLFIPYFLVFPVILNDMFQLLTVPQLATLIIVTAIISIFLNYKKEGTNSIKSLILYSSLTISIIVLLVAQLPTVDPTTSSLLINTTSMQSSATVLFDNNINLDDFLAGLTFVVSLFVLIFSMPFIAVAFLSNMLMLINPDLANAFVLFSPAIFIGLMAYLIIKAYEIISNRVGLGGV